MKIVVYSETGLDYKYSNIFDGLDVECKIVTTIRFLKLAFRKKDVNKKYVYHIRYLRWKGFLLTLPMYCLIILVCKLRRIPVLFTCHNLLEHRYPSKLYSVCVRNLVSWAANDIVVLHSDLKKHLARFANKVHVACYGEYMSFFRQEHKPCPTFSQEYSNWLSSRSIKAPGLIFVGEYSAQKRIDFLIRFLQNRREITALIVSPGCSFRSPTENIFLFRRAKVILELDPIMKMNGLVGYVAHTNISVPTAINMYASYGIPILGFNIDPICSLVKTYGMGEVFTSEKDMFDAFCQISNNYTIYQEGLKRFSLKNAWEVSRKVHKSILDSY